VATGVVTVAVLVAFVVLHFGPAGVRDWQAVIGVGLLLAEIGGITTQEQARHVINASVAGGRSELADGSTGTTSEGNDVA
jgi:carbon monoxide dehydrogenase subunit G